MPIPVGYHEPLLTPRAARSVEAVWSYCADHSGSTTVLPDGRCDVILRFNVHSDARAVPILTGPATAPYRVTYQNGDTWVGVRLRPHFGAALWSKRLVEMVDDVLRGEEVEKAQPAFAQIVSVPRHEDALRRALGSFVAALPAPISPASLTMALDALHTSGGRMPITKLADITGRSTRQLGRQFRASIGISPKTYSGLIQAHRALRLISKSGLSLSQIALEAGYADHAHMSRAVRQVSGFAPRDVPETLTQPGFFR